MIEVKTSLRQFRSASKLLHFGCLLKIGDTSGDLPFGSRTVRIAVSK